MMRIFMCAILLERQRQDRARTFTRFGVDLAGAPEVPQTLPDAEKTEAPALAATAALEPGVEADTVVLDRDLNRAVFPAGAHRYLGRPGVLDDVQQEFPRGGEQKDFSVVIQKFGLPVADKPPGEFLPPGDLLGEPVE